MLCTRNYHSAVDQLFLKNKVIEKEIKFVVIRGAGFGEGRLDKGSQKFHVFSCFLDILMRNLKSMARCLSSAMLQQKFFLLLRVYSTVYYLIVNSSNISWLLNLFIKI